MPEIEFLEPDSVTVTVWRKLHRKMWLFSFFYDITLVKYILEETQMRKISVLCAMVFLCSMILAGCGKTDEALDEYRINMATFFNHISEYHNNMNAIDVNEEGYVTTLLDYLDQLDAELSWMAGLEVPSEFSAVESLADEASENMTQAVSLFHTAYEGEEFDANTEQAAREYYERANVRLQYIVTILHGEIPEGEGVTYTETDGIFGEGYLNKQEASDNENTAEENNREENSSEENNQEKFSPEENALE